MNYVETVIIGGGCCGVNIALNLQEIDNGQHADRYLIIERDTLLSEWKTARWDDFQMNTPHVANRLHGQVDDMDDHSVGRDFHRELALWQEHIDKNNLRYKEHIKVLSVKLQSEKDDENNSRFVIEMEESTPFAKSGDTTAGGDCNTRTTLTCRNVICCSGQFAMPKIPTGLSSKLQQHAPNIVQMHSSEFKGPQQFPDKNKTILVVGSGQSGAQIADLLADQYGKKVWLCTCPASGIFRSFRGEDTFVWTIRMGYFQTTNEMRKTMPNAEAMRYKMNPIIGSSSPISYASLARKGVQILGSLQDVSEDTFIIASNRLEHVKKLSETYEKTSNMVRNWIASQPEEVVATFGPESPEPEFEPEPSLLEDNGPDRMQLKDCQGVIWCTGLKSSVQSYLKIPPESLQVDMNARTGSPDVMISETTPGLYYAGFPWVRTAGSAILLGFDADAKVLVEHLISQSSND